MEYDIFIDESTTLINRTAETRHPKFEQSLFGFFRSGVGQDSEEDCAKDDKYQSQKKNDVKFHIFFKNLVGVTLSVYKDIHGHPDNKAYYKNFSNKPNQDWIYVHNNLLSSQPNTKRMADTIPFNNIIESLYCSIGQTNAAQNAAKVICDNDRQACDQYSTSFVENLQAIDNFSLAQFWRLTV